MMSSMRGAPSSGRAPRRGKGKSKNTQYILMGVAGLAVVVVILLLLGGGSRKAAVTPAAKKGSSTSTASKKPSSREEKTTTARVATSSRDSRREERARQREVARAERKARGSKRARGGGYSSGGRSTYGPNTLRAVITDGSGTRMALVGERRLKVGDELEGRKVTEVGPDAIKIEYRQSQYTVRVGGSLY